MSNIGIRAQQKEKTRRALVDAAFNQLSAEKSFSNLSLREVSREAGIAPTSFYRHFKDMDELGLAMVDESGLLLRQLMRQARKRSRRFDRYFLRVNCRSPECVPLTATRKFRYFASVSYRGIARDSTFYCRADRLYYGERSEQQP